MRGPSPRHLGATAALSLLLVVPAAQPGIFVEQARERGLEFTYFNGMSGELYLPEVTGGGAALVDYDNDGDLDVYLVQGQLLGPDPETVDPTYEPPGELPLSDRLFRNDLTRRPDGSVVTSFVDVTEAAGVDELGYGMGVASGDFDGDGRIDLYVTNLESNTLWRNRGGAFEDVTEKAGADDTRWSVPATFFDSDRDGRLDLFVGNYVNFSYVRHRKCSTASGAPDYCSPLAYSPLADRLFLNRGDLGFDDVTGATGLAERPGNALGAVALDADDDGWTDLYVANDQMENFLWMNRSDEAAANAPRFREDALLAGVAVNRDGLAEASMGLAPGDVDGDGDEDLLITHLGAETNTLYVHDGGGLYRDRSVESGLGSPSWPMTGFGVALLDYDNDGALDALVANGAVRTIESQARERDPYPLKQRDQLFRNLGDGRFEEVTSEAALATEQVSRGLATGDLDGDGDVDAVIVTSAGPVRLLENLVGQEASWIGLAPWPAGGARTLGARLRVRTPEGDLLVRTLRTDGSYASASDPRGLVGLGNSETTDALSVTWSDGGRQRWRSTPVSHYLVAPRWME